MKIYSDISELIGNTPLLRLQNIEKSEGIEAKLLAKLEAFNPAGSAKDRVAKAMIESAEKEGKLKKGSVIIEPTSGNTGIGLAMVAISRGYRVILTMPDTMSVERRNLLKAYGAEIVLTDGKKGMVGAIEKSKILAQEIKGSFIPDQFNNEANSLAHNLTTGPEIWNDTDKTVDIFVAGVGTGGTITGVGQYLKTHNPNVKVIAVEPEKSAVLSGKDAGPHGLQGIGAGFVPKILDTTVFDEIVTVTEEKAYEYGRKAVKEQGILCGISSGAALYAAVKVASRAENKGKTIVVLLTDTGERYLSTPMFE